MEELVKGIHHITAIASGALENYLFYTQTLGLRLVKKTVNFDDPGTYHLYYGNHTGEPGTIMTFFPWAHIKRGRKGTGQMTVTAFTVPEGALGFWQERLSASGAAVKAPFERFGQQVLQVDDPDGLTLELIEQPKTNITPWVTAEIPESYAIRGFYGGVFRLRDHEPTARVLTDLLGFELDKQDGNWYRFKSKYDPTQMLLLEQEANGTEGAVAGGSVHHIAFRVATDDDERTIAAKVKSAGLFPTPQIDRQYFRSVYFREPGGILFEIATDPPGFLYDEEEAVLGQQLKLPAWLESRRAELEGKLPKLEAVQR